MQDSKFTKLDPRTLTLEPAMQARDVELIKDKRLRSAQEIKQEAQDKAILEDLRNGVPIKQAITVFIVNDTYYVVDGFHRTGACLKYLKENPDSDLMIDALVIKNRTYQEAFTTAQQANQGHGVGVTKDEEYQSKFRTLIVNGEFDLTVSQIRNKVGCSQGHASHIAHGLKACKDALASFAGGELINLDDFIRQLTEGLEHKYLLPNSAWDSKGFPKARPLSDAVNGRDTTPDKDSDEWQQMKIKEAAVDMSRLVERYREDIFREGLRKAVRGAGLGITISQRNKWLEQAGSVEGDESFVVDDIESYGF
ncbi:hypothetical protein [Shewanella sp. HL-SH2]|uniref:hypothetical protein n=1 Tax=Shewanella sp. HL-SH2 TaxID=3436238 RepID=UPI003EBA10B6